MQDALNKRIGVNLPPPTDEEKAKWILNYTRAMQQETAELVDSVTGVRIPPGKLTAIACDDPDVADAIADRLGGYRDHSSTRLGDVTFDVEGCRIIRDGS